MKRDSVTDIKVANAIVPVTLAASANGVSIDTKGFMGLAFIIALAAATGLDVSNKVVFSLEESDDNSVWTAVDLTVSVDNIDSSTDYVPGFGVLTIADNDDTANAYRIGYRGYARYVRVVATVTGTVSMITSSSAILSEGEITPDARVLPSAV